MSETPSDFERQLRERICELLIVEPFLRMSAVETSKALVASAFAWRDYNGGLDDTCHAANCLHKLVDEVARCHHQDYTPEKMREYLSVTHQP